MLRWIRCGMTVAFVAIAVPCIAAVGLAFYQWRPILPIGVGVSELSPRDEIAFLALEHALTLPRFAQERQQGGEILVAGPESCNSPDGSPLASALSANPAGKLKIRLTCAFQDPPELIAQIDFFGGVQVIYSCKPKCHEFYSYDVLGLGPILFLIYRGEAIE